MISLLLAAVGSPAVLAAPALAPTIATPSSPGGAMGMVAILTLATLIPALVLSCTCFVRFIVVLGFVRTGLATTGSPPNQVLAGLALFMTVFLSAPIAEQMYALGGKPYMDGKMDVGAALTAASPPLRQFLLAFLQGLQQEVEAADQLSDFVVARCRQGPARLARIG